MLKDVSSALMVRAIMGNKLPKYFTMHKHASSLQDNLDYEKSPEGTYLAGCQAILNGDQEKLSEVTKVASHYKVGGDILEFAKSLREYRDSKVHENYAYINKEAQHEMPLHTKADIVKSSSYFNKYYMHYPFETRAKIANKIVKKASEQKIDNLTPAVVFYSMPKRANLNGYIDWVQAGMNIASRINFIKDASVRKLYGAISKLIGSGSVTTVGELTKLAESVEKLDRANNLFPYTKQADCYGDAVELDTPIVEIMGGYTKQAERSLVLGDNTYTTTVLKTIPRDVFEKVLPPDKVNKIISAGESELVSIISALEPMDKILLDKYIRS